MRGYLTVRNFAKNPARRKTPILSLRFARFHKLNMQSENYWVAENAYCLRPDAFFKPHAPRRRV
jgi:hypothetical protein